MSNELETTHNAFNEGLFFSFLVENFRHDFAEDAVGVNEGMELFGIEPDQFIEWLNMKYPQG